MNEERWIVLHTSDFRGFTVVPARDDLNFGDPTKRPILLAMPMVFPCKEAAWLCAEALERMIGRLILKGTLNTNGLLADMEMRRS